MRPITNTKVEHEFKIQPNGCKDTPDKEHHISVKIVFDYSALNPDGVKIPDDILRYAVNSWTIKFQQIRNQCDVRQFKKLEKLIDGFNGVYVIKPTGTKTSKSERQEKALCETAIRFTTEYPGITPEDMGLYALKKITLDELRVKYPKGDILNNINKAKNKK